MGSVSFISLPQIIPLTKHVPASSKSKFAPAYKIAPNFHGITLGRAARWATTAGYFGAATGIFVFFMFAEIPRVSKDIAEKVPVIGPWFHKKVAPEDNPF